MSALLHRLLPGYRVARHRCDTCGAATRRVTKRQMADYQASGYEELPCRRWWCIGTLKAIGGEERLLAAVHEASVDVHFDEAAAMLRGDPDAPGGEWR